MAQGIYFIQNKQNSKCYIGSSVDIQQRWAVHMSYLRHGKHPNSHLQASWNKYGGDTFEFGILEYLNNAEELHLAEQFWMDIYREEGKELYNYGPSARHGMLGTHHNEETKQKMRKSLNKTYKSCEGCKGRKSYKGRKKGHPVSDTTRCKISVALMGNKNGLGYKHTEEAKHKMSEAGKGRTLSEETKRKISVANTGRKHTEETKRKLSEIGKGRVVSEETRRKISEAGKNRPPISEETRRKLSKAKMGHKVSEETRRKLSEAAKAQWARVKNVTPVSLKHEKQGVDGV